MDVYSAFCVTCDVQINIGAGGDLHASGHAK